MNLSFDMQSIIMSRGLNISVINEHDNFDYLLPTLIIGINRIPIKISIGSTEKFN